MKRFLLIGFATCGFALAPNLSASAMPSAPPTALASDVEGGVIQVRGGNGHGGGHMGRGGRGNHYGWGRGRGGNNGYVVRRNYNSYGSYNRPGYGYYGGGPSIGFSFGNRGW